jgi:hypothetical protein
MMILKGTIAFNFTIPAGAGSYASEVLYLWKGYGTAPDGQSLLDEIEQFQAYIAALPATATIEIDVLKAQADPLPASGNWYSNVITAFSTTGWKTKQDMANWRGVRFRGKSGGTSGTATMALTWA